MDKAFVCFLVCVPVILFTSLFTSLSLSLSHTYTLALHTSGYIFFFVTVSPRATLRHVAKSSRRIVSRKIGRLRTRLREWSVSGGVGRGTVNREQESLLRAVMLGHVCKIAQLLLAENAIQCGASSTSGEVKRRVLPELRVICYFV